MKSFKEHMSLRQSRFADKRMSLWWGIEEIKEIRIVMGLLCSLALVLGMLFFNISFGKAFILSLLLDGVVNLTLSFISSYKEKQYRILQEAESNFIKTLNRFALNQTRKSYGSKTSL
jgi:hypothetical protein